MKIITDIIRRLFGPKRPDLINSDPSPRALGMRSQHFLDEAEYRRAMLNARFGHHTIHRDGTRTHTVIY